MAGCKSLLVVATLVWLFQVVVSSPAPSAAKPGGKTSCRRVLDRMGKVTQWLDEMRPTTVCGSLDKENDGSSARGKSQYTLPLIRMSDV